MDKTIGKLAKEAGVGVETVRFYERKGLIKKPQKRETGFRIYSAEDISKIQFIKRAQELGFTLREVKELLDLQSKKKVTGAQVKDMADKKIADIKSKIADLARMEKSLSKLSQICGHGEQAIRECKFFNCFTKGCN